MSLKIFAGSANLPMAEAVILRDGLDDHHWKGEIWTGGLVAR